MKNKCIFLLKKAFFLPLWEIVSKKRDKANTGKYTPRKSSPAPNLNTRPPNKLVKNYKKVSFLFAF